MSPHPREVLHRLRLTAVLAESPEERAKARELHDRLIEEHTKPTLKALQPVKWP